VDYARRRQMLEETKDAAPEELLRCWADGRIKMRVMQRLLRLRRENRELFHEGEYIPLNFTGTLADCVIGFVRQRNEAAVLVIVPRLSSRVGFPPVGEKWQDTTAVLPESLGGKNLRNVFCTGEMQPADSQLRIAHAMSQLPFAVLMYRGHSERKPRNPDELSLR
jgi:(1->4)-alpha-D-glucan 1-alpha-D-glucosylmutase